MNTKPNKNVTPLAIFRFSTGRTIRDVSAAAGISSGALANLERGRSHPRLETANALSRELNVPVADLFPDTAADPHT